MKRFIATVCCVVGSLTAPLAAAQTGAAPSKPPNTPASPQPAPTVPPTDATAAPGQQPAADPLLPSGDSVRQPAATGTTSGPATMKSAGASPAAAQRACQKQTTPQAQADCMKLVKQRAPTPRSTSTPMPKP